MSATQNIFKPGERIAVPTLPILKIESDVAILKKSRFTVGAECGARHKVRIETPFFVRGGFKVQKKTMYKVPGWAFSVTFRTPYDTFDSEHVPRSTMYLDDMPDVRELAEKLIREKLGNKVAEVINVEIKEQPTPVEVYVRRFQHVEVLIPPNDYFIYFRNRAYQEGDTYFVYEFISENEAKLVDDTSRIDYVVIAVGNSAESRAGCARIKILGGDVVWHEVKSTCCAIRSGAAAVVIAKYGSKVTVAYNNLPYRGCCETQTVEEWIAEFPPRRISSYETSEPVATELKTEEVV